MTINIFSDNNYKKFKNSYYEPMIIQKYRWNSINHYIYTNICRIPIYQNMIYNSRNPERTYNKFVKDTLKVDIYLYEKIIEKIIEKKINAKMIDNENNREIYIYNKFRDALIATGNKEIRYFSNNYILGYNGKNILGKIYEKYRYKMLLEQKKDKDKIIENKRDDNIFNIWQIQSYFDLLNDNDINLILLNDELKNINSIDELKNKLEQKMKGIKKKYLSPESKELIINQYNNNSMISLQKKIIKESLENPEYIYNIYMKYNIKDINRTHINRKNNYIFNYYLQDKIRNYDNSFSDEKINKRISEFYINTNENDINIIRRKIINFYNNDQLELKNDNYTNDLQRKIEDLDKIILNEEDIKKYTEFEIKINTNEEEQPNVINFINVKKLNIAENKQIEGKILYNNSLNYARHKIQILKQQNKRLLPSRYYQNKYIGLFNKLNNIYKKYDTSKSYEYIHNKVKENIDNSIESNEKILNTLEKGYQHELSDDRKLEIELGNNVEELLDKDRPKKEIIPIQNNKIFSFDQNHYLSPNTIEPVVIDNKNIPSVSIYLFVMELVHYYKLLYSKLQSNTKQQYKKGIYFQNNFKYISLRSYHEILNKAYEHIKKDGQVVSSIHEIDSMSILNDIKCNILTKYFNESANEKYNMEFYAQKLLLTGNKDIVYNDDKDSCLGTGINNDGQNIVGKWLMKHLVELQKNIDYDYDYDIVHNYSKQFDNNQILIDWVFNRLKDIIHSSILISIYLDDKMINTEHINTMINEIYTPCYELDNDSNKTIISEEFKNKTEEYVNECKNSYNVDIEYNLDFVKLLWNYISKLIYNIINVSQKNNYEPDKMLQLIQKNMTNRSVNIKKSILNFLYKFDNMSSKSLIINEKNIQIIGSVITNEKFQITKDIKKNQIDNPVQKFFTEDLIYNENEQIQLFYLNLLYSYIQNKLETSDHRINQLLKNRLNFYKTLKISGLDLNQQNPMDIIEDIFNNYQDPQNNGEIVQLNEDKDVIDENKEEILFDSDDDDMMDILNM